MTPPTGGAGAILLLILALAGFGAFAYRTGKLYRYLRLGRNEDRTDRPRRRIRDEIVIYLLQGKLFKRPYLVRGLAHAFIFWGFIVITVGTLDLLLNGILGWRVAGTESAAVVWLVAPVLVPPQAQVAVQLPGPVGERAESGQGDQEEDDRARAAGGRDHPRVSAAMTSFMISLVPS